MDALKMEYNYINFFHIKQKFYCFSNIMQYSTECIIMYIILCEHIIKHQLNLLLQVKQKLSLQVRRHTLEISTCKD